MLSHLQFRLRSIFYLTAIAAVLCLLLPPLVRTIQEFFASKRPPTQPPRLVEVHISDTPELAEEPMVDAAQSDIPVPADAVFIQTTIVRINGQRVDAVAGAPVEASPGEVAHATPP